MTKFLTASAAFLLLMSGVAHQAGAEVATGCLTASGRITEVAIGDTPDRPCRYQDTEITLQLGDAESLYYLTPDFHDGAEALAACTPGYHMASVWEILNPSNLQYDTALGFTDPGSDMGAGPPAYPEAGWIRNGTSSNTGQNAHGEDNCATWTSNESSHVGTAAALYLLTLSSSPIAPWVTLPTTCDAGVRVWCVEDKR